MYSIEELTTKVHLLKELKGESEALSIRIQNLENEIKSHMEEEGVSELLGEDWIVSWKLVESNRFNQSAFKEVYPELFENFKTISASRRFSVK